jgi:hypothetical protein
MGRKFTTVSKEEREYIPTDWLDDPKEEQLVITYKPLSKRQLAKIEDNATKLDVSTNTMMFTNAESSLGIFQDQVTGIKNLVVNDKPMKFKKSNKRVHEDIIDALDLDIIQEVSREIVYKSKFSDEAKEDL